MRTIITILSLLIAGQLYAQQPDTSFRATTVITQYSPSPVNGADWRVTFQANDLRGEPDLSDVAAGNILFDANCMPLRLVQVNVGANGPSGTIQAEFEDFTGIGNFPAFGPGAIVAPGPNGLIGTVQQAPERVNTCISWYNTFSDLGGGRVAIVDAVSDTATVFQPARSGDVIIKSDTAFIGHYTGQAWRLTYLNTASGGGGPVDWNDLTNVPPGFADNTDDGITEVVSDPTLTGSGISGDALGVDTTTIATNSYVINELNDRIEVYQTSIQSGNTTAIALPFVPDTRYPILLWVNGQLWSRDAAADFTLTGSTLNTLQTIFDGWRVTYQFTKQ